jgi:hypothetical protein
MTMRRALFWTGRGLLLLACVLVPACSKTFEFPDTPPAGPVVLMQDDFSGGMSTNWESLTPTSTVDATTGMNPPSLSLKAATSRAEVRSNQRFSTLRGLTVAADIQVSSGTYGDLIIIDKDNMTTINTLIAVSTNGALVVINGQSVSVPFTNGTGFHRFSFSLTPTGDAEWLRDGVSLMKGRYPVSDIFVSLADFVSGTNYDNVLITSP